MSHAGKFLCAECSALPAVTHPKKPVPLTQEFKNLTTSTTTPFTHTQQWPGGVATIPYINNTLSRIRDRSQSQ